MRASARWRGVTLLWGALSLGCDAGEAPVRTSAAAATGSTGQALISDATHSGGTAGFFFLPPMVAAPSFTGPFEARLSPRVVVDEIEPATGGVSRNVAEFAMADPDGGGCRDGEHDDGEHGASEHIRVDPADGHYIVNFHTDEYDLSDERFYRVRILVGDRELGFADLDVVESRRELRRVDTNLYVPLQNERTLPIKFRIERYVVDQDRDDVFDAIDNCPTVANADQLDSDADRLGDACECLATTCTASDDCHVPGTCDSLTGACDRPNAPDGQVCVDAASPAAEAACRSGACARLPRAIDLDPSFVVLGLGEAADLLATARDTQGQEIPGQTLAWTPSDAGLASVDADGRVTGLALGVGTITAAAGDVSDATTVLVYDATCNLGLSGPVIGGSPALLGPEDVLNLTAMFQVPGRAPFDATSFCTWSSSNPTVATAGPAGVISAGASSGDATITATLGALSATFDVLNTTGSTTLVLTGAGLPGGMLIGPGDTGATGAAASVIRPGQSIELTATFNTLQTPVINTQGYFLWASSNPAVATVSAGGAITATGTGFATITGSFGGLSGHFKLVSAPPASRARSCRGGFGDPHIVTHDGLGYDFQAAGEFLLAADNEGFEVQIRTEPVEENLSSITAVATVVDAHPVSIADEVAPVRVDGEPLEVPEGGVFFEGGGRIDRLSPTEVQVSLPAGDAVQIGTTPAAAGQPLSALVCPRGSAAVRGWRGLMGNGNGLAGDDLLRPGGGSYSTPVPLGDWLSFVDGWRLPAAGSRLYYPAGTNAGTYQRPDFLSARRGAGSLPADTRTWAEGVCRAAGLADAWLLAACILDVGATGDAAYTAAFAGITAPTTGLDPEVCVPSTELCDGADNNCNGQVDEGMCCASSEVCDGLDQDKDGQIDEGACCTARPEVCDGLDNDCNGGVDEACLCTRNRPRADPHVVLSNGYKTANVDPGANTWGYSAAHYGCGLSAGKWYWEVVVDGRSYSSCVGISTANSPTFADAHLSNIGPGGCYIVYPYGGGRSAFFPGYRPYGGIVSVGDVVSVLLDAEAGELRFWVNGVDQGRAPGSYAGQTFYPAAYLNQGCDQVTMNFGPGFRHAPPVGYAAPPGMP